MTLASALVAFGHFMAFFALTAALILQLTLLSQPMSVGVVRRVQRADRVSGICAIALLVLGFLRVFYFEKGADYYFDNYYFQAKLALFIGVGLISIYPSVQFFRWNEGLNQGSAPDISARLVKVVQRCIHWRLVLIIGIIFCASLMAKGFGA